MSVMGTGALVQAAQSIASLGAETSPGGGFLTPNTPNIVDFEWFLRDSVQIPTSALPITSPWPTFALAQALEMVPCGPGGVLYSLAVYNCATHVLFEITPDVAGQNYFAVKREGGANGFGLVGPIAGIVAATSDESTSTTLSSPDWTKKITATQLEFFRTPWGRKYLGWIQNAGPNVVGLT